jgi:hypothetical protein
MRAPQAVADCFSPRSGYLGAGRIISIRALIFLERPTEHVHPARSAERANPVAGGADDMKENRLRRNTDDAALFYHHTRFGAWTPWLQRTTLRAQVSGAGVYLLGYFEGADPSATSPNPNDLPFEVVYVGETRDLNARPLTGFYARVQERFVDLFGAAATQHLWVAVCPLYSVAEDHQDYAYQRTRSFYEEALLAWQYAQKHKHPPILQVKDREENDEWIDDAILKLTHGRVTKPGRHRKS